MERTVTAGATAVLLALWAAAPLASQSPQNPSPVVEHTRPHPRLADSEPPGRRDKLELGTLFIPAKLARKRTLPLLVHFHGDTWLPEVAATRYGRAAVISIQIGAGSGVYARAFEDPRRFGALLREAETRSGVRFQSVSLTSWSAGYGAVRAILRQPEYYTLVRRVLLIDGLHAGYAGGKQGSLESQLEDEDLQVFLRFARAVLKWGPMGTQQLSDVRAGRFQLAGYAGNSAPDHVDQLHALPAFLRWFK